MDQSNRKSALEVDSSVPLMLHNPKDIRLICSVKPKIHFPIFSDFRIQSWIFLKKRTLSLRGTLKHGYRQMENGPTLTPVIYLEL